MQWMRVGMGVAGGVLVIACSGSSPELIPNPANEPRPAASEVSTPAGSSSSSMPSEREAAKGGGEDAGIEASEPGPLVCGTNDAEPIDDCVPMRPCPECTGGRIYMCQDSSGKRRPRIDGCSQIAPLEDGRTQWCCPSECLRAPTKDWVCSEQAGGGAAFVCPRMSDTDPHPTDRRITDPDCKTVGAVYGAPFGFYRTYCCPE